MSPRTSPTSPTDRKSSALRTEVAFTMRARIAQVGNAGQVGSCSGYRFFAEITEKAIRRGSHTSVKELEAAINAYIEAREPKPFTWTATADAILQKLKRFCDRTSGTGH